MPGINEMFSSREINTEVLSREPRSRFVDVLLLENDLSKCFIYKTVSRNTLTLTFYYSIATYLKVFELVSY